MIRVSITGVAGHVDIAGLPIRCIQRNAASLLGHTRQECTAQFQSLGNIGEIQLEGHATKCLACLQGQVQLRNHPSLEEAEEK